MLSIEEVQQQFKNRESLIKSAEVNAARDLHSLCALPEHANNNWNSWEPSELWLRFDVMDTGPGVFPFF